MLSNQPNVNAALALLEENYSEAVYTLKQATTLIWGEKDNIAPLRTGKMLEARLPEAKLFIIKDAEHVPMNSHTEKFNQLLTSALSGSAENNHQQSTTPSTVSKGVLQCNNGYNFVYEGTYSSISLVNCKRILLKNIRAKNLFIKDSLVEMENVYIFSAHTALDVNDSVITVTNAIFKGRTGIRTSGSRLDFAGVLVSGEETGINIRNLSRLVFSISKYESPFYADYIHGNFVYGDTVLDPLIKQQ